MTLAALIQSHGYWLLAVGCLLEGETVLLLAGFAAHRGHLELQWVVLVAAAAGFSGDEGFFWLGRRHGAAVLARWPAAARQAQRVQALIVRYQGAVIVFVRFAYGLRTAGPVIIGMSPIATWRFAAFNALGALLWACVVGGVGWVFGQAAEAALGQLQQIEGWLLLGLATASVAGWAWRRLRQRR